MSISQAEPDLAFIVSDCSDASLQRRTSLKGSPQAEEMQATECVNARAEHDATRLLKPTFSQSQKSCAEELGPIRYGCANIKTVQQRSIPTWCKLG